MKKSVHNPVIKFHFPIIISIIIFTFFGCGGNHHDRKKSSKIDLEKEKQAIIEVIQKEVKTYYERDLEGWKSTYVMEPYQVRMGYWEGYKNKIQYVHGWDSLYNHKMRTIFGRKTKNKWDESTQEMKNVNIRIFPEVAWVTFEGSDFEAGTHKLLGSALGTRILEKKEGEWKIAYNGYLYYPIEAEIDHKSN